MNANRILTDAQIAQFRRAGLVFLPGFYDAAETREITAWVDEVAAWPEAPGRHMVDHEDSPLEPDRRMVQRIEDVTPCHPGFEKLFDRGRARGGGFKAHQDVQAGRDAYARYQVSILVSIDAADAADGCLELAAGWHDKGQIGAQHDRHPAAHALHHLQPRLRERPAGPRLRRQARRLPARYRAPRRQDLQVSGITVASPPAHPWRPEKEDKKRKKGTVPFFRALSN